MLPEVTSRHTVFCIRSVLINFFANVIFDHANLKKPLLNLRLNIDLHKPDADEIYVRTYATKTANHLTLL